MPVSARGNSVPPSQRGHATPAGARGKDAKAATAPPAGVPACAPPAGGPSNGYRRPAGASSASRGAKPRKHGARIPASAHATPHSPALPRGAPANGVRLSSASMRGTAAAQRTPSAHYSARSPADVAAAAARTPRPPDAAAWTARQTAITSYLTPKATAHAAATAAAAAAADNPTYYVVGGAVVNPLLMVSPSVQGEVRGVSSLAVLPDAHLRPAIGPQLHNTHVTAATAAGASHSSSSESPNRGRGRLTQQQQRGKASPPAPLMLGGATVEMQPVVAVEGIHTVQPRSDRVPLLQQTFDSSAAASALGALRQHYGTTPEDVIEVARTNPRSGAVEPPRLQYHLAQELLPELTGAEAQLKTLASARRRIDWDVSIPTADTLPPPAIAFTTADAGAPVATLQAVRFMIDTNTLAMARDYAAEAANCPAVAHGGTLRLGTATGAATTAGRNGLLSDEEKVGLDIIREERIGSSGLYCIRRLVGLRPGLGEKVGLERVLEYEVDVSAKELFVVPPYINASTGDLLMELNTSLQGTARLTITGVDCGTVDPVAGTVQRSTNTLTCYLALQHQTNTAAVGSTAAGRERTLAGATLSVGPGGTMYSQVPSATPRGPRNLTAGTAARAAAATAAAAATSSVPRTGRDGGADGGVDGFSLSLAHFNQDIIATPESGGAGIGVGLGDSHSRTPSPARETSPTATPKRGQPQPYQAFGGPRHENSEARRAGTPSSPLRDTGDGPTGPTVVSAAYASTKSPAAAAAAVVPHSGSAAHRSAPVGSGRAAESRPSGVAAHFLFPATNPHELRYGPYAEATRLRRVQQCRQQQALEKAEEEAAAQRRRQHQEELQQHQQLRASVSVSASTSPRQPMPASSGWSDEEPDRDTSTAGGNELSSSGRSRSTSPSGKRDRKSRKPQVEVLELEREFDTNGTVAMPGMATWAATSATKSAVRNAAASSSTPAAGAAAPLVGTGSRNNSGGTGRSAAAGGGNSRGSGGGGGGGGAGWRRSGEGAEGASVSKLGSLREAEAAASRELRRAPLPAAFFHLGGLQDPLAHLRMTVWQDRMVQLFSETENELLLRSEQRAKFKREARQELSDGAVPGMVANLYLLNGGGGNGSISTGGRRTSMHARRGSSTALSTRTAGGGADSIFSHASHSNANNNPFAALASRNAAAAAAAAAGAGGATTGGFEGGAPPLSPEEATEKTFTMLRRLILCLALEEERASTQLFSDTVQLCGQLCHSALLRTASLTRGTREGLQHAAAEVLAAQSPPHEGREVVTSEGNARLTGREREGLRVLHDALELSMVMMLQVGAYGEAVEYALQRVHALCLLQGDTDAVVNAAQRDLAEMYLAYGDYPTATTIAEDVVMLTSQLCSDVPAAYEVAEAEMLCVFTCVAAGRRDRVQHYLDHLELSMVPIEEGNNGVALVTQPLLQAQLRLVYVYAKAYLVHCGVASGGGTGVLASTLTTTGEGSRRRGSHSSRGSGMSVTAADSVTLLREAVRLLRGGGDLQEMEQSFSTVFPSQARTHAGVEFTGMSPGVPGGGSRAWAAPISSGRNPAVPPAEATARLASSQKRLRWNLLSFAGSLMVQQDLVHEGVEVMEGAVKELVLGQHRQIERIQRAALAAVLWVGLILTKKRTQPTHAMDIVPMLKQLTDRVVRIRGPLHPVSARCNVVYAYYASPLMSHRHAASIAARGLSAFERSVGPQSFDRLTAHYVAGLLAEGLHRWRPAMEHFSAAYAVAQAHHLPEADLLLIESRFIGALLLCPPTTMLDINTTQLCTLVEGRLQRARERYGPHSERLVEPLWNVADMFYLLKDPESAMECLQQATRLLDRRGVLLVSTDVLKPAEVLVLEQQELADATTVPAGHGVSRAVQLAEARERGERLVAQRDGLVQTSFDTVSQTLQLATTLFMWGAILEAMARTSEAQARYGQALALFEATHLGDNTLAAVRVMEAIAKLLYTADACGDALTWARRAETLLHTYYRHEWPLEHVAAHKLVDATAHRLKVEEGTHVVQSGLPTHSTVVELL